MKFTYIIMFFGSKKNDFVVLMESYTKNWITLEEFEIAFSRLWTTTMKEFKTISLDLEQIKDFQPDPKSQSCGLFITAVYRTFEELEDELCTEEEARDYIIDILGRLNNVDDSLFIEKALSNLSNSGSLTSASYNDDQILQSIIIIFIFMSLFAYSTLNPTIFNLIKN